jgi:hypothetical protein
VADCYEKLGEPEKQLRQCAMLACTKHRVDSADKLKHLNKVSDLVKVIGNGAPATV